MSNYNYDATGLPTSYLFFTFTVLFIIFIIIKIVQNNSNRYPCPVKGCYCGCKRKTRFYYLSLSILILLISFLVRNMYNIKMKSLLEGYDPYEILGIEKDTPDNLVKRGYKRIMKDLYKKQRKFKASNTKEMLQQIEEKIIRINTAFDLIKNPSSYENWVSQRTKKELLVAIPTLIFNLPLLGIISGFGIFVGIFQITRYLWKNISLKNSENIYFTTFEDFFEKISFIENKNYHIALTELLVIISRSKDIIELSNITFDVSEFKNFMASKFSEPIVEETNEFCSLMDFLYRGNFTSKEHQKVIQKICISILTGYQSISLIIRPELYPILTDLKRMFLQAISSPEDTLLQFPFISSPVKIKKPSDIKKSLLDLINDPESVKMALKLYDSIPRVKIQNTIVYSLHDSYTVEKNNAFLINPSYNSYVEFTVQLDKDVNEKTSKYAHAPNISKKTTFTVFLVVDRKIDSTVKTLSTLPTKVKMALPELSNMHEVQINVCLDDYLGFDKEQFVKVKCVSEVLQNEA